MIGTTISHYRVESRLGAGGMGVVYLARDLRLQRDVAIKMLPDLAVATDSARKEFRKEALILSRLNHPHIGAIFDFDQDQGIDFLVLELVEGITLSERIESPIDEAEIARLGEQLAEGLAAAHREGILHRDIKPSNLKITPEGRLKILDFGVAKLTHAPGTLSTRTETSHGDAVGTLPYMAPEQLRGEPVDARSDLYAAGAVLYEMACARRAFPQASTAAVAGAILSERPPPVRTFRKDRSADLESIVMRCLEKNPSRRYATALDLASDLRQLQVSGGRKGLLKRMGGVGRSRTRPKNTLVALAAGAMVVTAALLFLGDLGGVRTRLTGVADTHSLAVLPLANLSGNPEQDFFADGMTDELITRLSQVAALHVISRSSAMVYKGTRKSLREIAEELDVDLVVEGSVNRSGERVRISAQLVDARRDRSVWADSYERPLSDVLVAQSEVARAVVENVRLRVTDQERERLKSAPAVHPRAHEEYLRGLSLFNGSTSVEMMQAALSAFQRSVAEDPGYAPAYAWMANTYYFLSSSVLPTSEAVPRARAAVLKALELDPNLAAAHVSAATLATYDWKWAESEREYLRALELNPGDVAAHQYLGVLYTAIGRFREAESEISRARALDPLNSTLASMSLWPLFEGRQYDRAIASARVLLQMDAKSPNNQMVLGQALLMSGDTEGGIAELRKATGNDPRNPFLLGWLAFATAYAGNRAEALKHLETLQEWSRTSYVQPYLFALVYTGLGDKANALSWLERAAEARSDELFFLKVDPGLDRLRDEPRFQAILRRMNFPSHAV